MISRKKTLGLACAAALIALVTGCNDTLRQFINPIPGPSGDPGALAHAVVLSTNPIAGAVGSDMHIDVSGDTVVGVVNTGPNPQSLGKGGNRVFILNGDNTISSYIALLPLAGNPQVVTQPTNPPASGAISGGTSSTGNFYTANQSTVNASVVSTTFNAVTDVLSVGPAPVAIAGNFSNSKIYVVNNTAPGTVTPVSTVDNAVLPAITVGNNPIWAVMSADGVHVFVVNQGSDNVSVIDTLLDIVIAIVPLPTGSKPNYAVYDAKLKRVYVSNTGSNSVSVIDASRIDLAAVPQQLPTNIGNVQVSGAPTSIAALSDGSRVYAALGNCAAGINQLTIVNAAKTGACTGNSVSVIDAIALREKKVIPTGSGTISIDAATNSSRVYAVNANDRNVSIIRTTTDTVDSTISAPLQSLGCQNPASCPQNVRQFPFQVRIFP
jgi:YVTN family beta-propeller protein